MCIRDRSELVQKMAGIEPIGELSEPQIAALSGGPLLQSEAALTHIPTPPNAGSVPTAVLVARTMYKKGGARLLATLTASHLALPLLILMAQQRQACVFVAPADEAHIKSLGSTLDHVQETLFQYVHFWASTEGGAAYAAHMLPAQDLLRRFGLDAAVAFHIARPKLAYEVKVRGLLTQTMRYDPGARKKDERAAASAAARDAVVGDAAGAGEDDAMQVDAPEAPEGKGAEAAEAPEGKEDEHVEACLLYTSDAADE